MNYKVGFIICLFAFVFVLFILQSIGNMFFSIFMVLVALLSTCVWFGFVLNQLQLVPFILLLSRSVASGQYLSIELSPMDDVL